jgi:hypothetical protein
MGYEDQIRVTFSYLEARFLAHLMREKIESLETEEQTPQVVEWSNMMTSALKKLRKKMDE